MKRNHKTSQIEKVPYFSKCYCREKGVLHLLKRAALLHSFIQNEWKPSLMFLVLATVMFHRTCARETIQYLFVLCMLRDNYIICTMWQRFEVLVSQRKRCCTQSSNLPLLLQSHSASSEVHKEVWPFQLVCKNLQMLFHAAFWSHAMYFLHL